MPDVGWVCSDCRYSRPCDVGVHVIQAAITISTPGKRYLLWEEHTDECQHCWVYRRKLHAALQALGQVLEAGDD